LPPSHAPRHSLLRALREWTPIMHEWIGSAGGDSRLTLTADWVRHNITTSPEYNRRSHAAAPSFFPFLFFLACLFHTKSSFGRELQTRGWSFTYLTSIRRHVPSPHCSLLASHTPISPRLGSLKRRAGSRSLSLLHSPLVPGTQTYTQSPAPLLPRSLQPIVPARCQYASHHVSCSGDVWRENAPHD